MAQRSSLARRLRAIEADRGHGVQKHPMAMTDDELWRALDIRDPATGALRKDLTDEELKDLVRQEWERAQAAKLGLE